MLNPKPSVPVVLPEWFKNAVKIWEHRSEKLDPQFTHGMEALAVVRRCLIAEPKLNLQVRIHDLELQLRECQQELAKERELALKNAKPINPLTYIEQITKLHKSAHGARESEVNRLLKWQQALSDPSRSEPQRLEYLRIELLRRIENVCKHLPKAPLYDQRQNPELLQDDDPAARPVGSD